MDLSYVVLYVENIQKTIDFYTRAFGLKHKFTHESGDYAEMDTGATTLAFGSKALVKNGIGLECSFSSKENLPFGVQITLGPDDVKSAYKSAIENGAIPLHEPEIKPWNFEVAFVRDIDGHLVELAKDLN